MGHLNFIVPSDREREGEEEGMVCHNEPMSDSF